MPPESRITSTDSELEADIYLPETSAKSRRNSTEPKYYCTIEGCAASFRRLDHLDRHEYHHTGIKKHACSHEGCDKVYSIITHLKRHLRTTHERTVPRQKEVPCEFLNCDKLFTSACNMQRHMREVHENPKVYHCPDCGEKFKQKLKMRRHEIKKHTGEFPYNCEKCCKGFYQKWQYERHVPVCKIYPCAGCTLRFEKWSLYMKHCKDTQHGRTYYQCEYCERMYGKPSELKKHVAAKHLNGEHGMSYKCTHEGCERTYSYERNLRQHIRTAHTGARFSCEELGCDRAFSSAQNLKKHLDRDHKRKKPDENLEGVSEKKQRVVAVRKTRKDAGRPLMSNLAKLSGLAVDKELDAQLRERAEHALSAVTKILSQETANASESDEQLEEQEIELCSKKSKQTLENVADGVEELDLDSLLAIVLQDD